MSREIDLSIIIVNWNVKELLRTCLASLFRHRDGLKIEVIVVDNNSSDGSPMMVAKEFPHVRLLALPRNMGFARANNRALGEASGRYIFILNPDTEVSPHALRNLVDYLDVHPTVACVAPRIVNPDRSFQKGSVRRNPSLASQLIILLKLQRLLRDSKTIQRYLWSDFDPHKEQQVDQVMGAAMCLRAATLSRIGLFDEKFFLWFEDVDLCRRLRTAGETIVHYPKAQVIHHGGASFKQSLPLAKQRIYNRSALYYFYKHHGVLPALLLLVAVPLNLAAVFLHQLFFKHGAKAI